MSPLCPSLYFPSSRSPSFSHLTLCTRPLVSMGTRLERVALLWSRRLFMELCHFFFFFFLPPPSFIFSTNLSVYPSAPHAEYKCPAIGVWILWFSTCQAAYVPVFPPCGLPLTLWGKCSADPFVFVRRKVILIFRVGTGRLQPRSHRNEKELEKLSRIVALEILKERFSWCIGFRIVPCQSDISLPL